MSLKFLNIKIIINSIYLQSTIILLVLMDKKKKIYLIFDRLRNPILFCYRTFHVKKIKFT